MQMGGGFTLADTVMGRSNIERSATLLANKAILPSGKRATLEDVMPAVKSASIKTGHDQERILDAWSKYTDKTGDFARGKKQLEFMGKLSKATGADIGQVADTMGILRVQNKGLGDKEMQQLLLDTVMAGRKGSVDMPELARAAGKITKTSDWVCHQPSSWW
jgi:hypothetical protein